MVQDTSEWRGFVRGECIGRSSEDEALTLTAMGCNSYMRPVEGGSPFVAELTT